jgi:hypothetical protein
MSFVSAIRDYTEILNNFLESTNSEFGIFDGVKTTGFYLVNSILYVFLYFFSFQWLQDLSHLPVLLPSLNAKILSEHYVLNNQVNLIEIDPVGSLEENKFLVGFLNAFFLALPLSVPQLLAIRRWLIQGSIAGLSSVIGFRFGQTFFYAAILLGLRFLIIPWLSYEPANYLIGLALLINVIYEMSHENLVTIPKSQTVRHAKIFAIHFALAWTEQSILFSYLSNNSFSPNFNNLDVFLSSGSTGFITNQVLYIFGLLIGGLIFDLIFLLGISNLLEFSQIFFKVPLSTWKKQSNVWFLRVSLALSFTSIPYYTLDYLFLNPFGLSSQDKSLNQGAKMLFNSNKLDMFRVSIEQNMFLDPYNRTIFVKSPLEGYIEPNTFENANYEGERAWKLGDVSKKANITSAAENTKAIAKRLFNSSTLENPAKLERKTAIIKPKPSDLSNLATDNQQQFVNERELKVGSDSFRNVRFDDRIDQDYIYQDPESDNLLTMVLESFPTFLNDNVKFDSRQEALIKTKFYSNPVYQNLLTVYIDSLLQQQPKDYTLSKTQEQELYKARLALEEYYNSLKAYAQLNYNYQFNEAFGGTKSFATKVYNQQFKGSLKVVRRLFGVTWDSEENRDQLRKISYDQALYQTTPANFYHEGLDLPKSPKTEKQYLLNPRPLYAGWDADSRKFTLANRYLSRDKAGFAGLDSNEGSGLSPYTKLQLKNSLKESLKNSEEVVIKEFSAWPVQPHPDNLAANNNFMFEFRQDIQNNKNFETYLSTFNETSFRNLVSEKLPLSVNFLKPSPKGILPPTYGGITWPGENALNFDKFSK